MKITKFTHACVRFERDGAVLVLDPGNFSESQAVDGADAVIITHTHADHLDVPKIAAAFAANDALQVLAPADCLDMLADIDGLRDRVITVAPGERHDVAGFSVATFGGEHATIVEGFPVPQNVGYLVDDTVYYPGDSFALPGVPVQTLFAPAHAPWMRQAETIAFVRSVGPEVVHPAHDGLLNPDGWGIVDSWFERATDARFQRLTIGE